MLGKQEENREGWSHTSGGLGRHDTAKEECCKREEEEEEEGGSMFGGTIKEDLKIHCRCHSRGRQGHFRDSSL